MRVSKQEMEEAKKYLMQYIKPGGTIYTILKHVSRSGMYRVIDLYIMGEKEPFRISGYASKLLEGYDRRHEGCKAGGCGMDMGFHLVYSLSHALFGEGFDCIGAECPSNDHSNGMPREYQFTSLTCPGNPCSLVCTHKGIPPVRHKDGGYALNQKWM
jgi:hypothetical protein